MRKDPVDDADGVSRVILGGENDPLLLRAAATAGPERGDDGIVYGANAAAPLTGLVATDCNPLRKPAQDGGRR
jgi:hypothetical protein